MCVCVQVVLEPLDLPVSEDSSVQPETQEQQVLLVYKFRWSIDELPDKLDVQVNNSHDKQPTLPYVNGLPSAKTPCH